MVQIDYDSSKVKWCNSDGIFGYAKRAELYCEKPDASYSGYYNTYSVAKNWYDYSDANYPAFAKAINYHAPGTTVGNKYYAGWFFPTYRELQRLVCGVDENGNTSLDTRANLDVLNNSITAVANAGVNGTCLLTTTTTNHWSSSQSTHDLHGNDYPPAARIVSFQRGIAGNMTKTNGAPMVIIRGLDD